MDGLSLCERKEGTAEGRKEISEEWLQGTIIIPIIIIIISIITIITIITPEIIECASSVLITIQRYELLMKTQADRQGP